MSRIRFPGYARMSYGFHQLSSNGSEILIDNNCFDPPTGRKISNYRFEGFGKFFESFENCMSYFGFSLSDQVTCKQTMDGIRELAGNYLKVLKYLIATNPRVQITMGVESEAQRAVGYMDHSMQDIGRLRKPKEADPEVWGMLKHLAKDQHDYYLRIVEGDTSPVGVLKGRGLLHVEDPRIRDYILRSRKRYELTGETRGVDEEIVALSILNSLRGRQTRILSHDLGLAAEVKGFFFDCFGPNPIDGVDKERVRDTLSSSGSSVIVNCPGILGDMLVLQDTHKLYKDGFVEPHAIGDFDKAWLEGWRPPRREEVERALEYREDITLDFDEPETR